MSIIEIQGGPITHRYLMNKTKDRLASDYMDLLRVYSVLLDRVEGKEDSADPSLAEAVAHFSIALLAKLKEAAAKYGYRDEWKAGGWREKLCDDIRRHVAKGDPRDVAAYCLFAWFHKWSLAFASTATSSLYRHLKRGNVVEFMGSAEVQTAGPIKEGDFLAVYQEADGRFWARPIDEFNDGRFALVGSMEDPEA